MIDKNSTKIAFAILLQPAKRNTSSIQRFIFIAIAIQYERSRVSEGKIKLITQKLTHLNSNVCVKASLLLHEQIFCLSFFGDMGFQL